MGKWTFLAYLAGDNNLGGEAWKDLAEMERVGSPRGLSACVQIDARVGDGETRARRYAVRKARSGGDVASRLLLDRASDNSGDPAVIAEFLRWGVGRRRAPGRTAVVLWNHGSGFYVPPGWGAPGRLPVGRHPERWTRSFFAGVRRAVFEDADVDERGLLYDDGSGDCLDMIELRTVLEQAAEAAGGPLDLLGMDACLMTNLEVAWEVRHTARVMVGSEETEPGAGWPYEAVLRVLADGGDTPTPELAARIVDAYMASFPDDPTVTQSALDLGALDPVVDACQRLATALLADTGPARHERVGELLAALRRTRRFYGRLYVDLAGLCAALGATSTSADVRAAATAVTAAVPRAVLHSGSRAPAESSACGLSVYLPVDRPALDRYGELDFAKRTGWGEVVTLIGG